MMVICHHLSIFSSLETYPFLLGLSMDHDPATDNPNDSTLTNMHVTRGYQQEMLQDSLRRNIIIALDTGSGKTHIAVLRLKHEIERNATKRSWFIAPTVALCEQQKNVIEKSIPVPVGIVSGANEPDQWKDAALWERVLRSHRIIVSTPQVLLDALRHGYASLGKDISLIVFDEAHHAVDKHPYNRIMKEFYFHLAIRDLEGDDAEIRPMILGLTASPIYGGNASKAFETIEANLDCVIRAPRLYKSELSQYVHRPKFKHLMYQPQVDSYFASSNIVSLSNIIKRLKIDDDPSVKDLRSKLANMTQGSPDWRKYDQKLSRIINRGGSFVQKGLNDFERAAIDICSDLGVWAADWFVYQVVERAKQASNPYNNIMVSWRLSEKSYLLEILNEITLCPVSFYPEDISDDSSDKINVLIDCLLQEKEETEADNDFYSTIIFVQRRDAVLALAEVLKHHPRTKDVFNIGILLGTSDSSHRHSMMDITRSLVKESQDDTITQFREGEKNLIVSTSVAEEGIDIQACGSVIRWDPPPNMASWAQSRGRARKRKSTFTLLFKAGGEEQNAVDKWETLERQMLALIHDPSRELDAAVDDLVTDDMDVDVDEDGREFIYEIESTGAKQTLHSVISHLTSFCSIIPESSHADNQPFFERDPPEYPDGWHLRPTTQELYLGPFGSTVTLPRSLPIPKRQFQVERQFATVVSAHRHAAFKAYVELHKQGLLNDHLLPITHILEPELEEEVKALLADVEKREGMAKVSIGIDPWRAEENQMDQSSWFSSVLTLEGLPPLLLFTKTEMVQLDSSQGPKLYRRDRPVVRASIQPGSSISDDDQMISDARRFTRMIFWGLNNTRMEWDNLDFAYLVLPSGGADTTWSARRQWLESKSGSDDSHLMAKADQFAQEFGCVNDVTLIQRQIGQGRPFKFTGWRHEPLNEEEEGRLRERYDRFRDGIDIVYPLVEVRAYPPRTNFLVPFTKVASQVSEDTQEASPIHLLPQHTGIILLSPDETEYSFLLPSIMRFLMLISTAKSLRNTLFVSSPIYAIPLPLLVSAITASSAGEQSNYQRLETLGDAVLKFTVAIQLFAEYPMWPEGYLTKRKDHAVSNVRLAKEDIRIKLYRWIIRESMLGKKWKPHYFSAIATPETPRTTTAAAVAPIDEASQAPKSLQDDAIETDDRRIQGTSKPSTSPHKKKKSKKSSKQLSTKILADVVESVIGAAFLHGGLDLGYEAVKFFDLGLKWKTISERIIQVRTRSDTIMAEKDPATISFPPQLGDVEKMIGYTFTRKIFLIEALTHASYQNDSTRTPSYERVEFLGDAILDLIVNDYLFHAPGKNYSPGHIFLRKCAVVNAHFLSYICLSAFTKIDKTMPRPMPGHSHTIEETTESQNIYLFQCLLHSSPKVLDDQRNTFARYLLRKPEIEEALNESGIFPWASLTRLQAPKFLSDMVESVIGAVYLDSGGSFDIVTNVLETLGIMKILKHIVIDDVDVLHPVSRLSLWSQKHEKKIEYDSGKESGKVFCRILVDGEEVQGSKVSDEFRGKASQDEVRFAAAEVAIKALRLRDVGVGFELLKKKKPARRKKRSKDIVE
ncbi:hypothetical protein CPB83DRAFT_796071 [Crepidotus variabilis]|uniref:P-loop containing nucleoside triphosphate hydrolase protein n=1 Tax=Crepidotus variabilis TaxID=179855 RepID=A0A9P6EAP7_9AGAR|nr:hypothetical protein CPB83DRAFT_796071 [Crepidotus variabilis]